MRNKIISLVLFSVSTLILTAILYCLNPNNFKEEYDKELEFSFIGDKGEYMCMGLFSPEIKHIVIPETYNDTPVTMISSYAFARCSNLESITIPDGITSIGNSAFEDCTNLRSVTIPDSITSIGNSAFEDCTKLKSITIPNSVTSIGPYAFNGCSSLESILIPDSVTYIGMGAFQYCSEIKKIVIPDNITTIESKAFYGCSSLEFVGIPSSVTDIEYQAFADCKNLRNITIPSGVTIIKSQLFANCTNLRSVTIPDSITGIYGDAFDNCPCIQYNSYDNAQYLGNDLNPHIALMKAANKDIISCFINPNTKIINGAAFAGCSALTEISIPKGVTKIGSSAFFNCSKLESVDISSSVTDIDDSAFSNCKIKNAKISAKHISSIPKTALEHLIITDGYRIYEKAFENCQSLESITIPKSVKYIGLRAFYNCNKLTIYAEAETQPEGWDEFWNPGKRPVVWGYKAG